MPFGFLTPNLMLLDIISVYVTSLPVLPELFPCSREANPNLAWPLPPVRNSTGRRGFSFCFEARREREMYLISYCLHT
jgi:hypothetical protein